MSWSQLLQYAPQIANVAGSLIGQSGQASDEREAGDLAAQKARLGYDYLLNSPIGSQYVPAGGAANNAMAQLLGLGGGYGGAPGGASSTMTPGMLAASQVTSYRNGNTGKDIGQAYGQIGGQILGTAVGGPVGGAIGGAVGGFTHGIAGNFLGNVFGADNASPMQDIAAAIGRGETITDAQWRQAGYGPGGAALGSAPQAPGTAAPGAAPGGPQNAFQNYLNSTGYNFRLGEGQRAITSSQAARGLLDSGATAKALTTFGQNIGSAEFDNYLRQLSGLAGQGLQAGGMIGSAGGQAGGVGAQAISGAYGDAASTKGSMYGNVFGGIGDILGRVGGGMAPNPMPGGGPVATGGSAPMGILPGDMPGGRDPYPEWWFSPDPFRNAFGSL